MNFQNFNILTNKLTMVADAVRNAAELDQDVQLTLSEMVDIINTLGTGGKSANLLEGIKSNILMDNFYITFNNVEINPEEVLAEDKEQLG